MELHDDVNTDAAFSDENSQEEQVNFSLQEQLQKYAQDFSEIYRAEKEKRIELKKTYDQLKQYADALKTTVAELKERNEEVRRSYLDTVERLVWAAEFKDQDTGDHIIRISRYSALLADEIGMSHADVEVIRYAAPMHDIGKIGIPDNILTKPDKLTNEEFDIIKTHTTIGGTLLSGSKSEILETGRIIALTHHEKWDGSGYPKGLKGEDIPLSGRLVCIVDVFDALTSKRPYKEAFSIEKALDIMQEGYGTQFYPKAFDIFLDNMPRIREIKKKVDAEETSRFARFTFHS